MKNKCKYCRRGNCERSRIESDSKRQSLNRGILPTWKYCTDSSLTWYGGSAITWLDDFKYFPSYTIANMSFRATGNSSSPQTGYTLRDHVTDIEAVCKSLELDEPLIVANSASVPWAIKFAANHRVKALLLIDRPAINRPVSRKWLDMALSDPYCPISNLGLRGIQKEFEFEDVTSILRDLRIPITLLRGGLVGSHIKDSDVNDYLIQNPNIRVVSLEFLQVTHRFLSEKLRHQSRPQSPYIAPVLRLYVCKAEQLEVDVCGEGTKLSDGVCIADSTPIRCSDDTILSDGTCVLLPTLPEVQCG